MTFCERGKAGLKKKTVSRISPPGTYRPEERCPKIVEAREWEWGINL